MDETKLHGWFLKNDIRSFGPQTGIMLVDILSELRKKLDIEKDKEIKDELQKYADSLVTVINISAIQQRAVIDKLEILLKKGK